MRAGPWVVALGGALVLIGWATGTQSLTLVMPGTVTMKIATAVCFVLAGIAYGIMARRRRGPLADLVASSAIMALSTVMGSLLFSAATHQPSVFDHAEQGALLSAREGRPSICTMLAFLVVASGGIAWMADRFRVTEWAGRIVALMGIVALTGYVVGWPPLYCYFEGGSSAMAVHTAALLVVLGVSVAWRAAPHGHGN